MTGGEKNENQIRRSKTVKSIKTKLEEDLNVIKKSSTMKHLGLPEEPEKQQKGEGKEENKDQEIRDSLKKQAEKIPVLLPAVRIADQEQPAGPAEDHGRNG